MTVGDRMKEIRVNQHKTLEQIARIACVSRATIHKYENNIITNIPADKIESVAFALNTTPAALMGWEETPTITEDIVTFPVLGDVAAGYDHIAVENWEGAKVDIPRSYLKGRRKEDFFVLRVCGQSMFPSYIDGDIVLVLRQATLNRSGEIGVVIYGGENATLKKIEYVMGEDWMKMIPLNPLYEPVTITGSDLETCRVLGIPRMVIREITE